MRLFFALKVQHNLARGKRQRSDAPGNKEKAEAVRGKTFFEAKTPFRTEWVSPSKMN